MYGTRHFFGTSDSSSSLVASDSFKHASSRPLAFTSDTRGCTTSATLDWSPSEVIYVMKAPQIRPTQVMTKNAFAIADFRFAIQQIKEYKPTPALVVGIAPRKHIIRPTPVFQDTRSNPMQLTSYDKTTRLSRKESTRKIATELMGRLTPPPFPMKQRTQISGFVQRCPCSENIRPSNDVLLLPSPFDEPWP